MMSARALRQLSASTWRLPLVYRCSSSSSAGENKDAAKPKQSTTAAAESKAGAAAPPPPPEVKFDNSKYQASQMYEYNPMSFYDIELDISPARCPQQSSLKK